MNQKTFKAMVVTEKENNQFITEIKDKNIDDLPQGDVLVKVSYSSLNYKDVSLYRRQQRCYKKISTHSRN